MQQFQLPEALALPWMQEVTHFATSSLSRPPAPRRLSYWVEQDANGNGRIPVLPGHIETWYELRL